MNGTTRNLRALGQSLWLDNISRQMLDDGRLARHIADYGLTGLTSNPTIFEKAIGKGHSYDKQITALARSDRDRSVEDLFFELALQDLRRAADLFWPAYDESDGEDGWVSLEVSPLLADDTAKTVAAVARLHDKAGKPNLFIKIPGTPAGLAAIESSIFDGRPVNVTLLFSAEQYLAAAQAYMRGIERRIEVGRSPRVRSVASLFVSRWDAAVHERVAPEWRNRLGIAVAQRTYKAYRELLDSARWKALVKAGAWPQRLLWASTGTKDPDAPDTLYVEALAAPRTINTLPDETLHAFADHGSVGAQMLLGDGDAERLIGEFRRQGIDDAELAQQLQDEGADKFVASWRQLMARLTEKTAQLAPAGAR